MRNGSKTVGLTELATEQPNPASIDIDQKSALEIARVINAEDTKVAVSVKHALPKIAAAIDLIANSLRKGGRLIYVGTGTSGRIAALDAVECPPTFGTDPRTVQFIIAGGPKALAAAVESNEDSAKLGERAIAQDEAREEGCCGWHRSQRAYSIHYCGGAICKAKRGEDDCGCVQPEFRIGKGGEYRNSG